MDALIGLEFTWPEDDVEKLRIDSLGLRVPSFNLCQRVEGVLYLELEFLLSFNDGALLPYFKLSLLMRCQQASYSGFPSIWHPKRRDQFV